ncbi:hypothetical protein JCM9157_290 [Halalkalibacter akibai JCM 9157]|uniref:Uncharacterized protein n=1 Tax=Halalkalibacter akibai (strain ATCC 43226 / DSM 21942 / CIP 109018 / JCM 9157 / 1139) TaxID=1236973 RepID=W4QPM4_HALA3|nr:hypothetical protein JCM9157_290 [Halalkalibacter akibai JCM 9157]
MKINFCNLGKTAILKKTQLIHFFKRGERLFRLDEKVRSGISTFANLASKDEIEEGCNKLKMDIETKKIENVLNKYSSNLGDYIYVVAEKK